MIMKFLIVLLLGLLCLATPLLFAQSPCPDKILTTSTTASVNIEKPVMKNFDPSRQYPMIFDWTRPTFLLHSNASDLQSLSSLQSPFFQLNNENVMHLLPAPDMQPDDGWELISQDLGYAYQPYGNDMLGLKRTDGFGNLQPVGNPYFILYNKYTGILRVFVAVGQIGQGYNTAQIRIFQVGLGSNDKQSSLLYESSSAKPVIALDEFPAAIPKLMAATRFINETVAGLWFYADFPTTYDPCTCMYSSSLQIEVNLISEAQIELVGETEGTLVSITNNQGNVDNENGLTSFGLTDLVNTGKKAVETFKSTQDMANQVIGTINTSKQREAIEKGLGDSTEIKGLVTTEQWQDFYSSLTPAGKLVADTFFQKYEKKKEEAKWYDGILSAFDFLEKPLKWVPFLTSAVDVLDFFIGGGKKEPERPQKVEVQPMAIRMTTELKGTITAEHPYKTIIFFTPGAQGNVTRQPDANYPMYNQTLGTFNLLKTPQVKAHYRTEVEEGYTNGGFGDSYEYRSTAFRYYQLSEDIKYVVNPAAGFDMNEIEVLAALVFEFDYDIEKELGSYDRSILVLESYNRYRTQYVPLGCIKDIQVPFLYRNIISTQYPNQPFQVNHPISRAPQVYVKLLVRLPRADRDDNTQSVLFVGKYPVALTNVPNYNPAEWTTSNAYDDVPDNITYSNQNVASRFDAWKTITVDAGTDVGEQPGMIRAQLTAGERITVKPGSRVHKTSTLRIGMPDLCTRSVPPASAGEVATFCASTAYQSVRQFPKEFVESVGPGPETGYADLLGISPNPSADVVTIRYSLSQSLPVTLEIINPLGIQVGSVVTSSSHTSGEFTATFDGASLARGVYYCVLRCNGEVKMQQFILY